MLFEKSRVQIDISRNIRVGLKNQVSISRNIRFHIRTRVRRLVSSVVVGEDGRDDAGADDCHKWEFCTASSIGYWAVELAYCTSVRTARVSLVSKDLQMMLFCTCRWVIVHTVGASRTRKSILLSNIRKYQQLVEHCRSPTTSPAERVRNFRPSVSSWQGNILNLEGIISIECRKFERKRKENN